MNRSILKLTAFTALAFMPGHILAQDMPGIVIHQDGYPPAQQHLSPAGAMGGEAGGMGAFSGYVPSANLGMYSSVGAAPARPTPGRDGLPDITDGRDVSVDKIDGFNQAIEQNFPMTPEMTRRYRQIYEENQRALQERPEPKAKVSAAFISLEPGEAPAQVTVAPGIASVLGFYDATGQPWPITQVLLGSDNGFQVVQLGENSSNVALTPLVRFGWTNLVVVLEGHPKPAMIRIDVSESVVDDRLDFQVMHQGPNARTDIAPQTSIREAGSGVLLAALTGVDMPQGAQSVRVDGVDARAWLLGDKLYIRSRHTLLSPARTGSMAGPEGIMVYELPRSSVALFSVNGQVNQAHIFLP